MADDDLLKGSEAVARAVHKHLIGQSVRIVGVRGAKRVTMKVGNYIIGFKTEPSGDGEINLTVTDVSDAR